MNDLFPTLRSVVEAEGLNADQLTVALEKDDREKTCIRDRHVIFVADRAKAAVWEVPTLQELFRGDRMPPSDMDHYPEAYTPHFFYIENHVLNLCELIGDRTDQEMEEVYSMLRRRPDGRSLGLTHDLVWQAGALLLGTRVLSGAEFEALIGAMERSTRRWALRPVSRNHAAYLHEMIEGAAE
jgi:hypothetical protein